ncbi:MAG: hypothetical protein VB031_06200 [Eubacteriaceae bacterium]|nr:hypothetical protein [Eubacteriaceae bacterium]
MMQNRPDHGWRKKLGFTEEPHIDMDYEAFTYMSGTHPDSIFNKTAKVSCYRDGYFYAVRNGCFIKGIRGDEEILEEGLTQKREKEICSDHFRLSIDL